MRYQNPRFWASVLFSGSVAICIAVLLYRAASPPAGQGEASLVGPAALAEAPSVLGPARRGAYTDRPEDARLTAGDADGTVGVETTATGARTADSDRREGERGRGAGSTREESRVDVAAADAGGVASRSVADIVADADMRDGAVRTRIVAQLKNASLRRRDRVYAKAQRLGIPVRIEHAVGGRVLELQGFEGDKPLYYGTLNADAALSAHVTPLHGAPLSLLGGGLELGVWDGGSVRSTHAELSSRVALKNSTAAIDDHATHVAGTMMAAGVQSAAKGMAPAAHIASYDWNDDLSEMALAGAASATDTNRLAISNHSYGYIAGYLQTEASRWRWFGSGTTVTDVEPEFGRYSSYARDWDAVAFSLPYYTIFKAAGNDRTDNPAFGHQIDSYTGSSLFAYDPAQHPGGDGAYRSGYESISYAALAKNIITVGAVHDAVSGGIRDISNASMSTFSSWGPADDGRIKPDLVSNGVGVYSSTAGGNTQYGSYSGTSMAAPAAAGAAALLVELYAREFAGRYMPSSLLKALMIHTADDLGTPGPDYRFGWGLVNAAAAADLIMLHKQNSGSAMLIASQLTSEQMQYDHTFEWDGASPIRATLAWTDPVGPVQTTSDSRQSVLVHNLDLVVRGPDDQIYQPFVMPFVGNWQQAAMSSQAIRGKNDTDNIEQVYLAAPAVAGTYTATVTLDGALTRSLQAFSLVVTGSVSGDSDSRVLSLEGDMDFGSVAVGSTASRVLTLSNLGNTTLHVSGIQVPEGFSAAWSGSIAPGAFQHVTVTFAPSASGYVSGLLQVASDATSGNEAVTLSGTGLDSVIPLTNGVSLGGLAGSQDSEQFFVLTVPPDQADLSVVMTGTGDADLYVRLGQLPTASQWDYRPYLDGSNERVDVALPSAGEWYLMIRGYTAYTDVSLTASYLPPAETTRVIRVTGELAFGNIPVGGSVSRTATIHNDGNAALTLTSVSVPAGFACDGSGVVPPGGSKVVDVTFSPTAEQVYTGLLQVSSDSTSGEGTLPVSGAGVESHIPMQNGVQAGPFSSQSSGIIRLYLDVPPDQQRLRLSAYNGDAAIDVLLRYEADPSLQDFDARVSDAGEPRTVTWENPLAGRWYIMLYAVAQYRDVRLVAEYEPVGSVERIIRVEGDLDFGAVRVNESVTRTYVIHNDGNATLTVTGVTYPPGFTGDGASYSVPAGGSQTVSVSFSPTEAIMYSGMLTVQSNADSGTSTLSVLGSGLAAEQALLLTNGQPVLGLNGAIGSMQQYAIDVPQGAQSLDINMSGGSGDADLHVSYATAATLENWDYRPYLYGNIESVRVDKPLAGRWYIMLHAWDAYYGVELVATYAAVSQGAPCNDFDGDGISDQAIFDTGGGFWYIKSVVGSVIAWANQWGWSTAKPVPGDYDGDGKADQAVFDTNGGYWYIKTVAGNVLAWADQWGWTGALAVPGDYDGDGISDQAIFDTNGGYWFIKSIAGSVIAWADQWGWSTAKPVPGDYDGDGKDDLAVFDTVGGFWYIKTVAGNVLAWADQWGWSGALAVPGDYDGDGISDQAVFDTNGGYWYIKRATGEVIAWADQWGWPTAIPVPGDYDGDGKYDLAVFDAATGDWYIKSVSGTIIHWEDDWGWPGAYPVGKTR